MAWHLFRLGRWSFHHRRLVAGFWLVVLVALGAGAATLSGQTSDEFKLSGIESTEAFDLIEQRVPSAAPDGATARIVFEAPEGSSLADPAQQQAVQASLAELDSPDVASVVDPYTGGTISQDGRVGYATVSYTEPSVELSAADTGALEDAKQTAEDAGLGVAIGGDALQGAFHPPLAELIGIAVALVVLTLTFGSLVAAGMPLLTAILGVGAGMLGITLLTGFVQLNSTTPALGAMLGLAVGIDYALFIMSRYQSEVRAGRPQDEAAGVAVGTAGSAVVFAGLTVVIALAGLSICGIGFLTQMGIAGAAMVAVAVVIALTLLPAILGFAGSRALGGGRLPFAKPRTADGEEARHARTPSAGRRWADLVTRFRWPVVVAGVALAAVASIPVASMQLALPDDSTKPAGSDARVAFDLISDNFGPGANGPLVVVVDTAGAADPATAVQNVLGTLTDLQGGSGSDIAAVVPPQAPTGDAAAAAAALPDPQLATITVIPASGPSDEATKELVDTLRSTFSPLPDETGARALVTGQTAVGVDISQELSDVFPLYLVIVVGLAFVLLVVVFRSLLVPLKAALGFLLSIGISLGATVAVFQWGWLNGLLGLDTTSPVLFILPILLTGILFGLAMDYEVFLVTRMREAYVHGSPARQAVVLGFQHSARVVVAAAVIMVGVFAGFAFTDDVILKTIGFALAVGVLADAFLVRMTIVPAVMAIVGEKMWWLPGWFDRALPSVDVEGETLMSRLGAADRDREPEPVAAG